MCAHYDYVDVNLLELPQIKLIFSSSIVYQIYIDILLRNDIILPNFQNAEKIITETQNSRKM